MPRIRSILPFLFVVIAQLTYGQEWKNLYQNAQNAQNQGNYATALTLGTQSLELYIKESGETSDNYTAILRLLENICYADGQLEKGLAYVKKELSIRESKKDLEYAEALIQQGTFQQGLEDYNAAETSFTEAVTILQQFLKADDASIVECQLNLGVNSYLKGDEEKASTLFDTYLSKATENTGVVIQAFFYSGLLLLEKKDFSKSIQNFLHVRKFYESQEQTNTIEYASLLSSLGGAYAQSNQLENAEKEYQQAQSVYETINIRDNDYLQMMNARAVNLQKMGNTAKAQEIFAGLSSTQSNGIVAAVALNNKAAVSQAQGDFKQAETYYREALSRLDKTNSEHAERYAETLQNLAVLFSDQGNLNDALSQLKESLTILAVSGNGFSPLALSGKIKTANVLLKGGDKENSKKLYAEVLNHTSKNSSSSREFVMAMNGMGTVLQREGNIRAADSIFHDLVSRYESGKAARDFTYPVVLNNFAALNQTQGSFLEAHDLFRKASNFILKEKGPYNISYATALENLAFINLQMGLLQEAKPQIDSILSIYDKLLGKQSLEYASAMISLGKYYQSSGDYPAAEPCFKSAYQTVKNLKSSQQPEELTGAISALAIFYQTMGNYEEAEPLFKQALDVTGQTLGKTSADYSTALQNLATLYQMEGKLQQASPMLEQALAIDEKVYGQNHPQYSIPLKNLAAVYQKLGKLDNAQVLLERALKISEKVFGRNHPSYALTISNLAALYQDRGNFKEAGKAWEQSVTLRKSLLGEQHPDYARSLYGLATNHFAQANFKEANVHYKVVVADYLKQIRENFPSLSEKEKGAFYSKIKPVFESYQDFCIQFYKANPNDAESPALLSQLYDVQLATKALLLNSSNKVRQSILSSGDQALISSFREWLNTKEQIVRYYSLSVEERKLEEDVSVLQRRANELEKNLSLKSAIFRSQMTEKEITSSDVSKALREGEAAVEIIRMKRKFKEDSVYYVALALKPNAVHPSLVIYPNGKVLENRQFKFHRNSIKHHFNDTTSYDHYWKPLVDQLSGTKNIFLSCDGIFNKINFNTLMNKADHRWVLDDFTISLVSNTKDIIARGHSVPKQGEVNLYGNIDFHLTGVSGTTGSHTVTRNFGFGDQIPMLPGTEKEVDQIQTLIQSASRKAISHKMAEANEINIKKTNNPAILHIATHGFFLNDVDISENASEAEEKFFNNPLLRSGLLLAGAGKDKSNGTLASDEDGILTAYEAMNLYLDETDLVVLSACETGLGEVRNGEGVYGLQRSFMVAGSNAVMMSLWQVDDVATQELMVQFYKHWMEGDPKLDAFKKAQLFIKEKYKSPYYWGAFILVGI